MAASSPVGGYDCELFVSSVPEELKCGLCMKVAREPSLTSCCGEHFCKLCIEQAIQDKKPCPSCGEAEFSVLGTDKRDHKKILALEVRCAMKDRGCDWTDTLEQLDAHLNVNSDNCQYIDVKCPNKCEQPVQKRHLPTHLAKQCTKRDFFCQYCNFKATYEVVCNDHWPQCPFYPIPCPNGCEIMALERGDLDAHLMLCCLEEVECEFSPSGCKVKLVREEMERHLADNLQRHVLMMNKAGQEKERKIEQLEARLEEKDRQVQELREEKDIQVRELEEKTQKQLELKDEQISELQKEIEKERQTREEKNQQLHETMKRQTQATHAEVARVEEQLRVHVQEYKGRFGVAQFTMTGFHDQRLSNLGGYWESPAVYTHPGGYRISIEVWPNGFGEGRGTHVAVHLYRSNGKNDDRLKWPADCTIILQLLNQHRDHNHFTVSKRFQWDKPTIGISTHAAYSIIDNKFIAHKDLDWNAGRQTQYLKNDCLQFRIYHIQVHSV